MLKHSSLIIVVVIRLVGFVAANAFIVPTINDVRHSPNGVLVNHVFPPELAQNTFVSTQFYLSLAKGVGPAKGEVHFKLAPGSTISRIAGTRDIRWTVQTETEVKVKFEYRGATQGWKNLRMDFGPDPIVASFREGTPEKLRQEITRIDFRTNGEPLEYFDEFNQPIGNALSHYTEVRKHLKIPNGASSLLIGQPFAGVSQPSSGSGSGLIVQQLTIPLAPDSEHRTNVTLQPNTELVFGGGEVGGSNPKNFIRLKDPTSIEVASVIYRPDGTLTKGSVGNVKLVVEEGNLRAANASLSLALDHSVEFEGINFSSVADPTINPSVIASGGKFSGRLKSDSRIEIARTEHGPALVEVNTAESANFQGLKLISSDDKSFTIEVQSGALPITGSKAEVQFDSKNYFNFQFKNSPSLTLKIGKSVWKSDQPPTFAGSMPAFAADILGGQLVLSNESTLKVSSGTAASLGLALNTAENHPAAGSFTDATFTLAPATTFGFKDQLATIISNGTAALATAARPLVFESVKDGPLGQFSLRNLALQSGRMKLGNQGSIQLSLGLFDTVITRNSDVGVSGKMSGSFTSGAGSLKLDPSNTYPIISGTLRFADLSISDNAGVSGKFQSVKFALSATSATFSNKLMVTTPSGGRFQAENNSSPFTISQTGEVTGKTALHFQIQQGLLLLGEIFLVPLEAGTLDAQADLMGTQPLSGTIALDATTHSGTFELNELTKLTITSGHVKADTLAFRNPDTLSGDFTLVEFQFAESSIKLPNSLAGDFPGATLDANGGPLTIQIGPGGKLYGSYHLLLPVKASDMTLGHTGVLNLNGGTIDLFWTRRIGQVESITAKADVSILSGTLEPIPGDKVTIKSGSRFKANALSVSDANGITGVLGDVDLTLGASTIAIPDGSTMDTKDGGHLTASTASSLTVPETGSFLQGSFLLDVPFANFYNSNDPNFKLKDGRAVLPLLTVADGTIVGNNCTIRGDLVITVKGLDAPFDVALPLEISDGVLTRRVGKPARLTGTLNVRIPASTSIPITTPQEDKGGDQHIFKVNFKIAISADVNFSSPVILNGKNVTICDMIQTGNLTIEVLSGNGEHPDGDFNSTNGKNAPNQEVYTDTFCSPFTCRLHVYMVPHVYPSTARFKVAYNGAAPQIEISGFQVAESIQWLSDGCGDNPCFVIAKTWREITGQESPDEFVQKKVKDKISGFQYTLKP
jgi:hypothetical protein